MSLTATFLGIQSAADLDSALSSNDATAVNSSDVTSKLLIKRKLGEVLADEVMVSNAKSRRRLRRFIDSIDVGNVAANADIATISDTFPDKLGQKNGLSNKSNSTTPAEPVIPVDLLNVLPLLRSVSEQAKLQHIMDSIVLPEPLDLSSEPLCDLREPLLMELRRLVAEPGLTNKALRRRMTRLQFVLCTTEEQAELLRQKRLAAAELAAAGGAVEAPMAKAEAPHVTETYSVPDDACSLAECLSALETCTPSSDIDSIITRTTTDALVNKDVSLKCKQQLAVLLQDMLTSEGEKQGVYIGAKLRRRVKRLLEHLQVASTIQPDVGVCTETDNKEIQHKDDQRRQRHSVAAASSLGYSKNDSEYTVASTGYDAGRTAPRSVSPTVVATESTSIELPVSLPLDEILCAARDATTAQELEDALTSVKPNSGNMRSRRLLKRCIERKLGEDTFVQGMNAKTRRRLTRILTMLAPDAARKSAAEIHSAEKAVAADSVLSAASGAMSAGISSDNADTTSRCTPYVLFVGQLNFKATAEDLRNWLIARGIEGNINIRLLTFKDSGESRGSAFVEVEGVREMNKCVALHLMQFQGRPLNIERSCGGSNRETRYRKIEQKRDEQRTRRREPIDRLLVENGINVADLGVDIKVALYNSPTMVVRDALKTFVALPKEKRRLAALARLIPKTGNSNDNKWNSNTYNIDGATGDAEYEASDVAVSRVPGSYLHQDEFDEHGNGTW